MKLRPRKSEANQVKQVAKSFAAPCGKAVKKQVSQMKNRRYKPYDARPKVSKSNDMSIITKDDARPKVQNDGLVFPPPVPVKKEKKCDITREFGKFF